MADILSLSPAEREALRGRLAELQGRLSAVASSIPQGVTDANWAKATGVVARSLEHVGQLLDGTVKEPRFPWAYGDLDNPAAMLETMAGYMRTLESGRDPFEGLFAEPTHHVVDHALIHDGERHHLITIRGLAASHWPQEPSNDFGHATSDDLVNWTIHEPVLRCPEAGWDNFQVWAPHIIRHGGRYWMSYTGVNENACQAIGIATSGDLFHWERHPANPVITPGPWGNGMWDPGHWSDCRDPMVLADDDGMFYCYYTAARRIDAETVEACVGVASSRNLVDWQDAGYIRLEKSLGTPPESPFMVKRGGRYFLFYTDYKLGTAVVVSDRPTMGFQYPPDGSEVVLPGVSASEVYEHGGEWYLSKIVHRPHALHFLGIDRLVWEADGLPRVAGPAGVE